VLGCLIDGSSVPAGVELIASGGAVTGELAGSRGRHLLFLGLRAVIVEIPGAVRLVAHLCYAPSTALHVATGLRGNYFTGITDTQGTSYCHRRVTSKLSKWRCLKRQVNGLLLPMNQPKSPGSAVSRHALRADLRVLGSGLPTLWITSPTEAT
jgi:hypothetical protein